LLLLRAVIGITALVQSGSYFFRAGLEPKSILIGALLAASGSMLTIGLWTQVASVVLAFVALAHAVSWAGHPVVNLDTAPAAFYVIAIAIAVALLGPGALSLDCRLFGPREIVIPTPARRS
jgi:uncharacterized membrane protein YphA (DoxX/SURF4 family)